MIFFFYFFSDSTEVKIKELGRYCDFDVDKKGGWKCNDDPDSCIPLSQVCDTFRQCEDDSDEKEGCTLHSNTGCESPGGKKLLKCPLKEKCVENLDDCNTHKCMKDDGEEGFACDDGLCINISGVCNKITNCDDETDESKGCDLYPETGKLAKTVLRKIPV